MKYNPAIHHRRSIRLRDYDYSQEGAYFITICVQYMRCIFGHIEHKEMIMNEFGEIAYRHWEQLPERWPHIELGAFQVMPNHFHGIVIINTRVWFWVRFGSAIIGMILSAILGRLTALQRISLITRPIGMRTGFIMRCDGWEVQTVDNEMVAIIVNDVTTAQGRPSRAPVTIPGAFRGFGTIFG